MATVHFILQGKGGVGKSFVASVLTQFLLEKGIKVICIDTDPINATFGRYKEFNVEVFNMMKGDNVDARKFDEILEKIFNAQPDEHIVVDNGASSFIPLMSYLKENDAISLIQAEGHTVYLHTVITGNQALDDTIEGLITLCVNFPEVPVVVWLNLFFGEIVHAKTGKAFEDFNVFKKYSPQFHSIITIPDKNKTTFGKDVEELLSNKQSFDLAINSSLPIMVRQRLKTYWNEFSQEINQANLLN